MCTYFGKSRVPMDNKYPDCNKNNNNELTHQADISVAYDVVTYHFIHLSFYSSYTYESRKCCSYDM